MAQQQRGSQPPEGKAQAQQAQERATTSRDPHYLQGRFLAASKGKRVVIYFAGNTGISDVDLGLYGTLIGADQFTIALKRDNGNVVLVYKSAIAFIQREEGGEA